MKKILEAYGFGKLQDLLTLERQLARRGISFADLRGFVEGEIRRLEEEKKQRVGFQKSCPACNGPMVLFPVNTTRRNQTGDESTAVWTCARCGEEIWETDTIAEIHKRMREEARNGLRRIWGFAPARNSV